MPLLRRVLPAAVALVLAATTARPSETDIPPDSAPTPAPGREERLQRLEAEIRDLRDQQAQMKTDLGLDGTATGAYVLAAGRESRLKLGGLAQVQADAGDQSDVRFGSDQSRAYLRRARLNAAGDFVEGFDFRVEAELAGSLGESTGMRAQLTDGYVSWKKFSVATLRAGQFKTPYGFEQLASDPKLFTIERSLGNDRLTLGRQVGAQAAGEFANKRMAYAAGAFNGTGANSSSNDNSRFTTVGRVSAIPWQSRSLGRTSKLVLGANAFFADDHRSAQPGEFGFASNPTGKVDNLFIGLRTGWGADAQYNFGPLDLWAEYLQTRFEPDNGIPAATVTAQAWYLQAAWFLLPARLQGVLKYDTYNPDRDVAANTTDTWTVGLNYLIKGDDLKLQVDYLRSDVPGRDEIQNKVIARIQVMF